MEFYNVFEEVMRGNNLKDEIQKMKAQIYAKRKPINEFEALLKETGYGTKNIKHNIFKMDFLDGTTMLNHYLIKYWFLPGWKEVLEVKDQEGIFDQVEKKLNKLSDENGCFTLTVPYVVMDCFKN